MSDQMERARSALYCLDPNCDRDTWVKYAMCLKHEFGEAGFDLWDEWSSQSDKYSASTARSTWKSIRADGKRTIGSLFFDAKERGWKNEDKRKMPNNAEIEARKAAAAARAEQAAKEEAEAHAKSAAWAQRLWDAAQPCESHPYLERKGVAAYGLRIGAWERIDPDTGELVVVAKNALLVPICDRQRKLWSLQGIFVDPNAKKMYLKGGAKLGHFHVIGKPQKRDERLVFILAEGYATGASVHAATGHMVLVCFDVANLMSVAKALREKQPEAWIVLAADNDTETEGNPGVTAACKAAKEVGGLVAVPPPGDFNDLQLAEGPEAVTLRIEAAFATHRELTHVLLVPTHDEELSLSDCLEKLGAAGVGQRSDGVSSHEWQTPAVEGRDDERRRRQQEENKALQMSNVGAMVPKNLSVDDMLRLCVYIAKRKTVAFVTEERSQFLSLDEFRALTVGSETEVEVMNGGRLVKKMRPNVDLWQTHPNRLDAMTRTFYPGRDRITSDPQGLRAVNTWRPIKRWPATLDVGPFLEQVAYLFPDPLEREVFLDWLAHIEQKPGELPHYGWLHIATNTGTGRNWLASLLARIFRPYVAPNVDLAALLESQFNGELGGRVLAIVDEVQEGAMEGGYRLAERLKSMVNAEMRVINEKYGLQYQEVNVVRWLVFSNHKNALPLGDSDRRFRVVLHHAPPRPVDTYEKLYALLDDLEFINAVGVFLRGRDISGFKPGERPPMNADKQAAINASKSTFTQNAEEIVAVWPSDVITNFDVIELLQGSTDKKEFTPAMRRAMEEAGAQSWHYGKSRKIKICDSAHRAWVLRNHETWLAATPDVVRQEILRAKAHFNLPASVELAAATERKACPDGPPI